MRDFGTAQLPAWPLAIGNRVDRSQLNGETVVKTSPDALHCDFDGRVIVLHRLDRVCFTMSPLAARLWRAMCHPKRLDEVVRELATSRDGTRVPVNILLPAGVRRDGSNPCVVTGYGAVSYGRGPSASACILARA